MPRAAFDADIETSMNRVDAKVAMDWQQLFGLPPCEVLQLPQPKPMKINLPTGGSFQGLADISKGIPSDCTVSFNLLLQLGPLLASIECLLKVLKLLKPLIDVVNGFPNPPVRAVQELGKAAVELAPCLLVPTPASILPFVRDVLCLILKLLKCFLGQLKSLMALMSGLVLDLNAAREAGDVGTQRMLECAQENLSTSMQHTMNSVQPLAVLLDLLGPFLEIAGVERIQIGIPAVSDAKNLEAMNEVVRTLNNVVATLTIVVEALGGCPG